MAHQDPVFSWLKFFFHVVIFLVTCEGLFCVPCSTTGIATMVPSSSKSMAATDNHRNTHHWHALPTLATSLLLQFLSFTRGFTSSVLTSACSFPNHHGLHVSQCRLPPMPSLEISQPKNTFLSLLILSLCGYWLLIVKSDDGFIGYGLYFCGVVLCWCWNFKWTMPVGFYCMTMEIEK